MDTAGRESTTQAMNFYTENGHLDVVKYDKELPDIPAAGDADQVVDPWEYFYAFIKV
jgi:hypothetical protein